MNTAQLEADRLWDIITDAVGEGHHVIAILVGRPDDQRGVVDVATVVNEGVPAQALAEMFRRAEARVDRLAELEVGI